MIRKKPISLQGMPSEQIKEIPLMTTSLFDESPLQPKDDTSCFIDDK
jgi:hypothetical protein